MRAGLEIWAFFDTGKNTFWEKIGKTFAGKFHLGEHCLEKTHSAKSNKMLNGT